MKTTLAIVALISAAMAHTAQAQDVAAGEQSFRKCLPCHAVGEEAKNKVGPELNGLDGRHSGSAPGYSYSDANKNSGLVWSEATLDTYLADPAKLVPGNKMLFGGLADAQTRADVIAYLKQATTSPAPPK